MSTKQHDSNFLKGVGSFCVPEEFTASVVSSFLSGLDCPRALTVDMLFRNGEHDQLAKLEFNPADYSDMVSMRDAYAATKFLSKYADLSTTFDKDKVALEKFDSFENLCRCTNSRFRALESDPSYRGPIVWLHSAVIRKISKILGDFDPGEFLESPDWGPGATTLMKRRQASSTNKFQCETGITRDLHSLFSIDVLSEVYPLWGRRLAEAGFPRFQVGNKVITVPKDSSTNRVIAIEPGINLWFQSSIGNMIKRRLRRFGVDLRYQSRNQQLAYLGSKDNKLATVDLSSASDSISTEVVRQLLPLDWFHAMDLCRSQYGSQSSSIRKWEKFSSMGNGFTFQLESLIFYAIASCCAEYQHISSSDVSAYGDDVILPSACFDLLSEVMVFYGFQINRKKSHFDSPFRESCGSHYYSGVDVKPVYLKNRLSSVLTVYRLANAVRRLSHRRMNNLACDSAFRSVFDLLVSTVPKALRLRIPETLGDGGLISNFDEAVPVRARFGVEGYRVSHVMEVSKTYQDDRVGYLLAALWSMKSIGPSGKIDLSKLYGDPTLLGEFLVKQGSRGMLEAMDNPMPRPIKVKGRNSVPLNGRLKVRLSKSISQQW